jgi:hypothetical protein
MTIWLEAIVHSPAPQAAKVAPLAAATKPMSASALTQAAKTTPKKKTIAAGNEADVRERAKSRVFLRVRRKGRRPLSTDYKQPPAAF